MKKSAVSLVLLVLVVMAVSACGDGESKPVSTPLAEPMVITLGNLTDITGPSANAQEIINMALVDIVKYYNDEEVIPGVRFKLLDFDTRLDPSRYLAGYEWLIRNGADFIVTGVPGVVEELRDRANEDKIMVMTFPASKAGLRPAGYTFCLGTTFNDDLGYTALKWIAEHDPDFPRGRPAKIGGAAWDEPYMQTFLYGAEQYCLDNPELFEWAGGYITDFSFAWDDQVESLKECDYVIPPQIMDLFALKYRSEGYSAKFVGIDAHLAFLNLIDKADAWEAIDGMLYFRSTPWWNEEGESINFVKEVLTEYHPEEVESIMSSGTGYLCILSMNILFGLIEDTVAGGVGDRFDSQMFYEGAQSFSIDFDGSIHGFTANKRTSASYVRAYEMDASRKDIFKVDSEWYPISCLP